MASGFLSFWCDSVPLEAIGSCTLLCLVHRRPLPALVSLGYYKTGIKYYKNDMLELSIWFFQEKEKGFLIYLCMSLRNFILYMVYYEKW